ncbi:Hypothetical_protein [Hexamita inflata]|uniref:Hypothetical_protein n=1 Tax=Hexamita inflata TaxID=28002 RepID=A0AA86QQB6_9EUKA|nr:Hypothetical protein HINF_LOCUS47411 [Hexamita inflata]
MQSLPAPKLRYIVLDNLFSHLTYDQNWNLNCFYIPLPISFFHSYKFSLNNFTINTQSQTCLNSNKQLKVTQNNGQNRNYKLNILQFFTENFISYFKEYEKQQRIRKRKLRKVRQKTRFELRGCFYRKRHFQWFASYNKSQRLGTRVQQQNIMKLGQPKVQNRYLQRAQYPVVSRHLQELINVCIKEHYLFIELLQNKLHLTQYNL